MQKAIHSIKTFFGLIPLKKRMYDLIDKYNSDTFDDFRYHIITVKSKEIIQYINLDFSNNSDRMNDIFVKVCKESYNKFSPVMIYTFNNEINFVFDLENDYYKRNINKRLTSIVSYITNRITKELFNHGINMEFMFTGKFIEFEKDYETFNYLVWRQCECYRNNILALAKERGLETHKIKTKDLFVNLGKKESDYAPYILNGSIIKKEIIYVEKNTDVEKVEGQTRNNVDVVLRTFLNVDYIVFSDSFSSNIRKYLYNKML
jgi:hypothetical protein